LSKLFILSNLFILSILFVLSILFILSKLFNFAILLVLFILLVLSILLVFFIICCSCRISLKANGTLRFYYADCYMLNCKNTKKLITSIRSSPPNIPKIVTPSAFALVNLKLRREFVCTYLPD
jgi:hypothetical protein